MLDVVGYEGLYSISPEGKVWSYRTQKFLKPLLNNKGYWYVQFWVNNKHKVCLLHRLIAATFIPNPNNLPEVNHKDAVKTNNSIDNLEWCTHRQNMEHCFKNNLRVAAVGERASRSKLKEWQVLEIRANYKRGLGVKMGKEYGVGADVISEIMNRKIWKHI